MHWHTCIMLSNYGHPEAGDLTCHTTQTKIYSFAAIEQEHQILKSV